jgi:hypothetical protein
MSQFLDRISAQVTLEKLRQQDFIRPDGRRPFDEMPDFDPRPSLLATRPFQESQPGELRDIRKARAVPCPQRDQLVDELSVILAGYGKLYIYGIDRRLFDERHQIMKALETLQMFLERQGAPRRHKKLWCQLDDLANGIKPLAEEAYAQGRGGPSEVTVEREWRDWWTEQQRNMVIPLYDTFQLYGPAREDFPRESIYHSMAAILEDLGFEPDSYEGLPTALRKRHNKALEHK